MTDSIQTGTIMSIDPKKHRIRIYKSTLHALGDPMYIQLLVSTTRRIVAVKCVEGGFIYSYPMLFGVDRHYRSRLY